MDTDLLHWLGYPAAFLTTLAFVPQAWMTVRTRNVQGISATTYLALTVGVFLWLIYGIGERDWALVTANAITLPLAGSILATKLLATRRQRSNRPGAAAQ